MMIDLQTAAIAMTVAGAWIAIDPPSLLRKLRQREAECDCRPRVFYTLHTPAAAPIGKAFEEAWSKEKGSEEVLA